MRLFDYRQGNSPLVLSIPHAGTWIPDDIAPMLREESRGLPDTDWFVPRLYALPALQDATRIIAQVSRYVVDLNRPPSDESLYPGQATTGVCPETHFDGNPVYRQGYSVGSEERERRIGMYWRSYHEQLRAALDRSLQQHGYAVLLDAHSIASRVPRLFDGQLPDLNFGTNQGRSCSPAFEQSIERFAGELPSRSFSSVVNGRFIGGYITRHYGGVSSPVEAVQLEISQAAYMDESNRSWDAARAARLQVVLSEFAKTLGEWRPAAV